MRFFRGSTLRFPYVFISFFLIWMILASRQSTQRCHKPILLPLEKQKKNVFVNATSTVVNAMMEDFSSSSSRSSFVERRNQKQVSFGLQQTAYFAAPPSVSLDQEERKALCWYSDSELQVSREEARRCIHALQQRLAEEEARGNRSEEVSIDSLVIPCPLDASRTLCLRGIEKYADAAAKYAGQKRHVGSVLHHHSLGNKDEHVALVAQTLSQPFKDVAYYYAIKSAEEQDALRKQDEEERQQAAKAVLFLLMGGKKREEEPSNLDLHHLQDETGRRTPPEMVSTNSKRSRDSASFCGEKESFARNVKPCLRVITE
jgi:hypothetical protein